MTDRAAALAAIDELLVRRATQGLDAHERAELDGLLAAHPEVDDLAYDLAAAAVLLGSLTAVEPMPEHVRRRVSAGRTRA